jgi:hypothetical protein
MEGGEVLLGKSLPFLGVTTRPEIAGQAPDQALTAVVDLYKRHLAMIA